VATAESETISTDAATEPAIDLTPEPQPTLAEQSPAEAVPEFAFEVEPQAEEAAAASIAEGDLDPIIEAAAEPAIEAASESQLEADLPADEFEFELVQETTPAKTSAKTTDDLISELVAELDDLAPPDVIEPVPVASSAPVEAHRPASEVVVAASIPPAVAPPPPPAQVAPQPQVTAETLNQLSEVFQEFRDEMGEDGADEDEDLETHYNLGIAYREMGLLDEAIGEFQKVAKAIQKGKPFAYAMNCSTMLALSFNDKSEPKIAALWYQRALDTPGLDQEAVLALRYDLGVSLEQAGESNAALDSFRQVYAMNIDYRDVADRIAVLQKR
jgi:tetratricopeptide (TPR) repeat protein